MAILKQGPFEEVEERIPEDGDRPQEVVIMPSQDGDPDESGDECTQSIS